jgi:hypothetical protein
MADKLGVASGLLGGGDSTLIPAAVRAMMAKKKAASSDNTPKVNVLDDIKAANANPNAAADAQKRTDSIGKTFDHAGWLKHVNEQGYELVKKKQ